MKPTRKDLLRVIGQMQDLVGQAKAIYLNDRGERAERIIPVLEQAHDLAIQATSYDPPVSGKWPKEAA